MNNYEAINAELKAYCDSKKLLWLEDEFKATCDRLEAKFGDAITDEMYSTLGKELIDHIEYLFTPSVYGWGSRIALAWHFLFRSKL